ncbi:1-deoxy-D-xylulose-5-phosphate reductoisomerase [Actinomyces viscosus]|uniref:1-deoxy-D-xylulose 5-phosphate reductoisomerase n=1 Tax=Actinomyces viscosus TaxID=1656 RepID=A0A3S4Z868_ACTVI|nr:1-deoxy-D-xylulose-5-phosphate reductoisomerase [Actinomyces viscosus]TFH54145.1 1-deoxy-D-xylulose-5-phosphate reductoisomerase [Actinomyces viscosus]VEI15401.1 1-deoxy-D-xylulose 5-phosphate reductoisomerase [Actinomyces viscosus]
MTGHAPSRSHSPQSPRRLVLLGSTGSIGTQTLEVLSRLGKHAPRVVALAAGGSRLELLARQAITWEVPVLAVTGGGEDLSDRLRDALAAAAAEAGRPDPVTTILTGPDAATTAVEAAGLGPEDTVVNGITGSVGLLPTLAALRSGARLALANKESLVVGGALVRQSLTRPGQVVPVDSEHSAIAQALASGRHEKGLTSTVISGHSEVRRLVLTASGGPFRGRSRAELTGIGAAAALNHPTWDMGPVVTINSSTLINKGLELIEAHLLFDVAPEQIDVVVHPQSVIHSMVEFTDGATIAQASPPDMRLPIALGLTWPERPDLSGLVEPNRWSEPVSWAFEPLDGEVFPAVDLARSAVAASPTHPAVLNAANEQAVAAFLAGGLQWLDIVEIDAAVVGEHEGLAAPSLDDVLAAETWARTRADELIAARNGGTHS